MQEIQSSIDRRQDCIRGSMIGGAAGDALGYAVEFISLASIRGKYGPDGITSYEPDPYTGKALISDDTQMALFTANGILVGETRLTLRGIGGRPIVYVPASYQDWLTTQISDYKTGSTSERCSDYRGASWLLDVPELYARRAPGNTCLSALRSLRSYLPRRDYLKSPINSSKGCGGIMRIAPLGLYYNDVNIDGLDMEGAILSAITHGHSLGYMPSAVLTHILNRIVCPSSADQNLKSVVLEAKETVCRLFCDDAHIGYLAGLIDKAILLSENDLSDTENIRELGEGWVAEETLAIALYCALRYEHDFSAGLIASVNHSGDSDSTGAVTGNILGAIAGFDAIEQKWKDNLELYDVILEISDDLYSGCSSSPDENWCRKYIDMHR